MKCVIAENGKPSRIADIKGDLDSLQDAVGGYIEHLGILEDRGIDLWVNEEGLYLCEPNRMLMYTEGMVEAGYLSQFDYSEVGEVGEPYTIINGTIVALGSDGEGDCIGLTDEQADWVSTYLDIAIAVEI